MSSLTLQAQPPTIEMMARRFGVLSEPMRLRLLQALREGEKSVGELAAETQATHPNVSRHLSVLSLAGLLHRRKQGQQVFYSVSSPEIFTVCERLTVSFE